MTRNSVRMTITCVKSALGTVMFTPNAVRLDDGAWLPRHAPSPVGLPHAS